MGSTDELHFLQIFSFVGCLTPGDFQASQKVVSFESSFLLHHSTLS